MQALPGQQHACQTAVWRPAGTLGGNGGGEQKSRQPGNSVSRGRAEAAAAGGYSLV